MVSTAVARKATPRVAAARRASAADPPRRRSGRSSRKRRVRSARRRSRARSPKRSERSISSARCGATSCRRRVCGPDVVDQAVDRPRPAVPTRLTITSSTARPRRIRRWSHDTIGWSRPAKVAATRIHPMTRREAASHGQAGQGGAQHGDGQHRRPGTDPQPLPGAATSVQYRRWRTPAFPRPRRSRCRGEPRRPIAAGRRWRADPGAEAARVREVDLDWRSVAWVLGAFVALLAADRPDPHRAPGPDRPGRRHPAGPGPDPAGDRRRAPPALAAARRRWPRWWLGLVLLAVAAVAPCWRPRPSARAGSWAATWTRWWARSSSSRSSATTWRRRARPTPSASGSRTSPTASRARTRPIGEAAVRVADGFLAAFFTLLDHHQPAARRRAAGPGPAPARARPPGGRRPTASAAWPTRRSAATWPDRCWWRASPG